MYTKYEDQIHFIGTIQYMYLFWKLLKTDDQWKTQQLLILYKLTFLMKLIDFIWNPPQKKNVNKNAKFQHYYF